MAPQGRHPDRGRWRRPRDGRPTKIGTCFGMSTPGLVSRNARIWSRPVLVRLIVLTVISATALAGLFALQRRVDWQIDIAVAERSQEARLAEAVRYLEDRVAELAEDLDLLATRSSR